VHVHRHVLDGGKEVKARAHAAHIGLDLGRRALQRRERDIDARVLGGRVLANVCSTITNNQNKNNKNRNVAID
jgi:hypothetical protein